MTDLLERGFLLRVSEFRLNGLLAEFEIEKIWICVGQLLHATLSFL
jgi:hypothetical protein